MSKMKKIIGLIGVLLCMVWISSAWSTEVRDDMYFSSDKAGVTIYNLHVEHDFDVTGDFVGDIDLAGALDVANEFVQAVYVETGMSDYTYSPANGNFVFLDFLGGASGCEVEKNTKKIYLPVITAAMDGLCLTFKSTPSSSTTAAAVISATTGTYYGHGEYIETVPGTTSGNTLRFCTDNSGVSVWVADYISGSTSIWRLVNTL
jgi:hypothetical protein